MHKVSLSMSSRPMMGLTASSRTMAFLPGGSGEPQSRRENVRGVAARLAELCTADGSPSHLQRRQISP